MIRKLILALCLTVTAATAQLIRLGTSAPKDTYWHTTLVEMAQEWKRISGGRVTTAIFPGGVQGSEAEMIRKVRIDVLQGIAISGASLPLVDRSVQCLSIPMMLDSYEEFDYVFERVKPELEKRLMREGFVVLNWADAGWVYFFTKKPARTLTEIKAMRLFTSAGDAEAEKLYSDFGFHPIPLAPKDLNDSLLRGVVEAFDVPPLFALAGQTFASAKNMVDVRWAPLVAATLISQKAWNKVPEDIRPKLLEAARQAGERARGPIRKQEQEAVATMVKHGLNVVRVDAATLNDWRTQAESAWPRLVGKIVPEDLFLEVKRLRDEYRKAPRK
jgi:TRAP-type C4-dicarboxylate transport system substrate-binding protein